MNYIDNQIVDEGNLFFIEIFQLIKEGIIVLEFHPFFTLNELMDITIEYQWLVI